MRGKSFVQLSQRTEKGTDQKQSWERLGIDEISNSDKNLQNSQNMKT